MHRDRSHVRTTLPQLYISCFTAVGDDYSDDSLNDCYYYCHFHCHLSFSSSLKLSRFWLLLSWALSLLWLMRYSVNYFAHRYVYECEYIHLHIYNHKTIKYNRPLITIMSAMTCQITSLTIVYPTVYSGRKSKKTSKLRVTGLCEGNSPVTGEFPAQRASYAENVSIWWRHHEHESLLWLIILQAFPGVQLQHGRGMVKRIGMGSKRKGSENCSVE